MVILKLTKSLSDEFECELVEKGKKADSNLVRPCERYKEMYNSCKSIKSKIYQYYVYGESLDCSQHLDNYDSCKKFRKTGDTNLLDSIIEWEKNLIMTRLKTVEQNKTWDLRTSPPQDFEAPLPEHLAARQKKSLFYTIEKRNSKKE